MVIVRIRSLMPKAPGGHFGFEWSYRRGDDPHSGKSKVEEASWATHPNGALLQALKEVFEDLRTNNDPVLIENPMRSQEIDNVVLKRPTRSGPVWRQVLRALDARPVRVQYSDTEFADRAGGPAWPMVSPSRDATDRLAKAWDEERRGLQDQIRRLELEVSEASRSLAEANQDWAKERRLLQDRIRALESNLAIREKERGRPNVPPRVSTKAAEAAAPINHGENLLEGLHEVEQTVEARVRTAWAAAPDGGRSLWNQLDYQARTAITKPLLMAELIRSANPFGDDSFEWPAFLLARNTEYFLNEQLLPALVASLSQQDSIPTEPDLGGPAWRLTIADRRSLKPHRQLTISEHRPLTLDDWKWVLWDGPEAVEPRPAEWQEAIQRFLQAHRLLWMEDPDVGRRFDRLRHVRNREAHSTGVVSESQYTRFEDLLVWGPQAWWKAWLSIPGRLTAAGRRPR